MRFVGSILLLAACIAGGAYYYINRTAIDVGPKFRTVEVERGNLVSMISATGTVEPEEVVDVGAQVNGRIYKLGIDPNDPEGKKSIDYGSIVHEGTILAYIDSSIYNAQLNQATAALLRAKADLLQLQVKLHQAEQEWKRAESLKKNNAIADADFDIAEANFRAAEANVEVGKAVVQQNEAAVVLAQTNYNYTIIKSPVEGVIVARRVNVGQTVVSSLNAPSLFLIAKDLRRIQVWASVNEADIGRIKLGMPVRFTVDTYPNRKFEGKVAQIRLNATMTQNVVTYTVVVETDNLDGALLPYLTANLQFEVERHPNSLLVPNTALRWRPRKEQIEPTLREKMVATSHAASVKKSSDNEEAASSSTNRGRLWVVDGEYVRPIEVQIVATDGMTTCIENDELKEGTFVVTGEIRKTSDEELTNPFAPKLFSRPKNQ